MKVRLKFETPDVVEDAVEELEEFHIREEAEHEIRQARRKWAKYGELLTVEVDMEKGTCEVIPA